MSERDFTVLLNFFKVLGNENRLKIIGLLASGDLTVREIAQRLHLKEPTVSEHLAMLKEADLVTFVPDGNFRRYHFQPEALRLLSKELLSREGLAALVDGVPTPTTSPRSADRRTDPAVILSRYLKGETLTTIPTQRRALLIVLKWLADKFTVGERYTEKEVNAVIAAHHADYATLRRELIDFHFMERAHGIYWRTPETEPTLP